jgi:hypothetical protein
MTAKAEQLRPDNGYCTTVADPGQSELDSQVRTAERGQPGRFYAVGLKGFSKIVKSKSNLNI